MAYPVIFTDTVNKALAQLAPGLLEDLYAALLAAGEDPWAIPRLSDRHPPELRLLAWGGGHGLAILVIDEPGQRITLRAVDWPVQD